MIARESVGVGEWSRCSPFNFDSLTHSRIPIAIVIRPLTHSLRVLSASGSGGGALGTNGCNCITLGRWEHCMFGVASTARPTFSRIFPPHVVYYSEKGSKQSPEKKWLDWWHPFSPPTTHVLHVAAALPFLSGPEGLAIPNPIAPCDACYCSSCCKWRWCCSHPALIRAPVFDSTHPRPPHAVTAWRPRATWSNGPAKSSGSSWMTFPGPQCSEPTAAGLVAHPLGAWTDPYTLP